MSVVENPRWSNEKHLKIMFIYKYKFHLSVTRIRDELLIVESAIGKYRFNCSEDYRSVIDVLMNLIFVYNSSIVMSLSNTYYPVKDIKSILSDHVGLLGTECDIYKSHDNKIVLQYCGNESVIDL